jgi:hypothetical protein
MLSIRTFRDSQGKLLVAEVAPSYDPENENRNDWKTFEAADEVASKLGPDYIATDAGPGVYPRYDVVRLPKVGDEVSYAFNGDSYPCGKITHVGKSKRVVRTDGGRVFYRRKMTGSWVSEGMWFLVHGHVSTRNPSF